MIQPIMMSAFLGVILTSRIIMNKVMMVSIHIMTIVDVQIVIMTTMIIHAVIAIVMEVVMTIQRNLVVVLHQLSLPFSGLRNEKHVVDDDDGCVEAELWSDFDLTVNVASVIRDGDAVGLSSDSECSSVKDYDINHDGITFGDYDYSPGVGAITCDQHVIDIDVFFYSDEGVGVTIDQMAVIDVGPGHSIDEVLGHINSSSHSYGDDGLDLTLGDPNMSSDAPRYDNIQG